MNFELGKDYIVTVNKKGIIPLLEFDSDKWYNKDNGKLDFLTDEEKVIVINAVLDKIKVEIAELQLTGYATVDGEREIASRAVMQIIDKYRTESEEKNGKRK